MYKMEIRLLSTLFSNVVVKNADVHNYGLGMLKIYV